MTYSHRNIAEEREEACQKAKQIADICEQHIHPSRGRHTISGKVDSNNGSSRYIVDCHDGFPHIVNQWQVSVE